MYQRILDQDFQPTLSENGHYMLRFRYLARTAEGTFERPVDLFRRVAWNLAQVEKVYQPQLTQSQLTDYADRYFILMTDGKFLPNAPTLLGAGWQMPQLHACFVLPVGDSIDEIFETLRMAALIHSKGGGTGLSFSHLRARGAPIKTGGVSTGPVSFLRLFDEETEIIKQGGTGWGANMGVLGCNHPDIREFITAKSNGKGLKNFNLSVGITDEVIKLYHSDGVLPLVDPHTQQVVDQVPARELFDLICQQAWETGEPGLLFLDRINRDNPTPQLGRLEATNPCGEAPLLPYEACCLGGLDVGEFVDRDAKSIRWDELRQVAALALRMMDNVIEMSRALPPIEAAVRRNRKVGIGVMGFADLLIELDIPYNSIEAEALAQDLMRNIQEATREASARLGEERGNFPAFATSVWPARGSSYMRNATTTSNPPNSTISVIAGCSAGIEPLFALSYKKQLANGDCLTEIYPPFIRAIQQCSPGSERLLEQVRQTGSIQHISEIPDDLKRIFVTAHDIEPRWHIRIQSAFQRYTDLGISKTVNLPHDARWEDVREAFLFAHEQQCKGITCYRDGCQDTQFLALEVPTSSEAQACPICK